jgi:hemolysin III
MEPRAQTLHEEVANTASHGLGVLLALGALPLLLSMAAQRRSTIGVLAVCVFCGTMALLYLASVLYHALPAGPAKQWCKTLDHAAIFIFIAGSYTPFALGVVRTPGDWLLFALVWALALAGVWLKFKRRLRHRLESTGAYVALGALAFISVAPLLEQLSGASLAWLVGGGLAYVVGVGFFVFDERLRYGHLLWHLCALAGSGCHTAALLHVA